MRFRFDLRRNYYGRKKKNRHINQSKTQIQSKSLQSNFIFRPKGTCWGIQRNMQKYRNFTSKCFQKVYRRFWSKEQKKSKPLVNGWLHSAEKPEIQADRISGFLFFGFKIFSTCCFNLQKILRIYIQRNKIVV